MNIQQWLTSSSLCAQGTKKEIRWKNISEEKGTGIRCGTNEILAGVKLFSDETNKYYYKNPGFNAWNLYNSFTEYYGKKVNFFEVPDKTRDLFEEYAEVIHLN